MPVGVKQHLMALKKLSPHEESTAVRRLDIGHLQPGALATQDRAILTPVELERLAWPENQRHKSPAPRCPALLLPVRPPVPGKCRNAAIATRKAQRHQIGIQAAAQSAAPDATCPPPLSTSRKASRLTDQVWDLGPAS